MPGVCGSTPNTHSHTPQSTPARYHWQRTWTWTSCGLRAAEAASRGGIVCDEPQLGMPGPKLGVRLPPLASRHEPPATEPRSFVLPGSLSPAALPATDTNTHGEASTRISRTRTTGGRRRWCMAACAGRSPVMGGVVCAAARLRWHGYTAPHWMTPAAVLQHSPTECCEPLSLTH